VITLAHSSDLHLGTELEDGLLQLRRVLAGADQAEADVILLVGDTFEHIRYPLPFFQQAGDLLANAGRRVVVLPGNHDPLFEASEPNWQAMGAGANVTILGLAHDDPVGFADLDLEFWGWAHRSYGSMDPLRNPPARVARWQIALAHGHYTERHYKAGEPSPSWLIFDEDIDATRSDYLALGHWNMATRVGPGLVPAYYSGSPDLENTVNIIRLNDGGVAVDRHPLPPSIPSPAAAGEG
jgi:DNA repair exonuclease SbcCD nuclease subunit